MKLQHGLLLMGMCLCSLLLIARPQPGLVAALEQGGAAFEPLEIAVENESLVNVLLMVARKANIQLYVDASVSQAEGSYQFNEMDGRGIIEELARLKDLVTYDQYGTLHVAVRNSSSAKAWELSSERAEKLEFKGYNLEMVDVHDVAVTDLLKFITDRVGLELYLHDSLPLSVATYRIQKMPWDQFLHLTLVNSGYGFEFEDGHLLVCSQENVSRSKFLLRQAMANKKAEQ